ncbi:hypothetical protein NB724_000798 [Pantoea ananatis]|nr:hypothetical protein [Pantoea ananatis]MCW0333788.1 hypothetical protein [Pantoea ananatis]MCW0381966.1 hypothetical protein [Pantoea ananatis]
MRESKGEKYSDTLFICIFFEKVLAWWLYFNCVMIVMVILFRQSFYSA